MIVRLPFARCQLINWEPCLKLTSQAFKKSTSEMPICRRVSRMVGQVPSPTPRLATSGDSRSITLDTLVQLYPGVMPCGNNARCQPTGAASTYDNYSFSHNAFNYSNYSRRSVPLGRCAVMVNKLLVGGKFLHFLINRGFDFSQGLLKRII